MSISKKDLFAKIMDTLRETNANPEDAIEVLSRVTGSILDNLVDDEGIATAYQENGGQPVPMLEMDTENFTIYTSLKPLAVSETEPVETNNVVPIQ